MNKRLQELAEQAEEWNEDGDKCDVNLQKFAELIIKECADVADNADATREKWQSIGKFVKEHFGVEE